MPSTSQRPRLVVVAGPTAVGKTGLALTLAEAFGGQIVNADSMQVYRYMDIGTGQAHTRGKGPGAPSSDSTSVIRTSTLTRPGLSERPGRSSTGFIRADIPIIVAGGTGLYLRSLLRGLFRGPGRDPLVRARLQDEARINGPAALHDRSNASTRSRPAASIPMIWSASSGHWKFRN